MNLKSYAAAALAAVALVGVLVAPQRTNGQATAVDDPALVLLVTELTSQQAALVENQARIDAKLAEIGENIRLSRIYVGRGGGKVP